MPYSWSSMKSIKAGKSTRFPATALKLDLQYLCCRSDNATQGRGFTLRYRELTNGCGGSLQLDAHNDQQIIMSPNYPNSPPQVILHFSRCPLTLAFTCSTRSASGLSWLQQGSESTWTLTDWMSRAQGGLLHYNSVPASSPPMPPTSTPLTTTI